MEVDRGLLVVAAVGTTAAFAQDAHHRLDSDRRLPPTAAASLGHLRRGPACGGVTVAGVAVVARTAEAPPLDRLLAAAVRPDVWQVCVSPSPRRLGASSDISTVTNALAAAPFETLSLPVAVNRDALHLYVSRRARALSARGQLGRHLRDIVPIVWGRDGRVRSERAGCPIAALQALVRTGDLFQTIQFRPRPTGSLRAGDRHPAQAPTVSTSTTS